MVGPKLPEANATSKAETNLEGSIRIRFKAEVPSEILRGADGAEMVVPGSMMRSGLRDLVCHLVGAPGTKPNLHFLVDDEAPLRGTSLSKHLIRRGRTTEAVVLLTYYFPIPAPDRRSPQQASKAWLAALSCRVRAGSETYVVAGSYSGCPVVCKADETVVEERDVVAERHSAPVKGVAWLEDGSAFVTAGQDGVAKIWAFEEPSSASGGDPGNVNPSVDVVATFRGDDVALGGPFESVAASKVDGNHVVALGSSNGSIIMLRDVSAAMEDRDSVARKRKRADVIELGARHVGNTYPDLGVTRLRWRQSDDTLVSVGLDGMVRLWDVGTSAVKLSVPAGGKPATGLVESESSFLVSGTDGRVRVLDARDGQGVLSTAANKRHKGMLTDVEWLARDSSFATSCIDGTVAAWDMRALKLPVHIVEDVHGENGRCLRISSAKAESKLLLFSAGEDGKVHSMSFET